MTDPTATLRIPAFVSATFTWQCPFGCTVSVVGGVERPHACAGEAVILDAWRSGPQTGTFGEVARYMAEQLKPLLREQLFAAWKDGVLSGRRGPCFGVDYDV